MSEMPTTMSGAFLPGNGMVERLVRWGIHPEDLITHRFPLEQAGDAYALMDSGRCGKIAVVFE